jgi:hypothetical protein
MSDILDLITLEDRIVTVSEAREHFKGCVPNWKMFAEAYNFDWKYVRRHGIKASEMYLTGDALAMELLNYVYRDKL